MHYTVTKGKVLLVTLTRRRTTLCLIKLRGLDKKSDQINQEITKRYCGGGGGGGGHGRRSGGYIAFASHQLARGRFTLTFLLVLVLAPRVSLRFYGFPPSTFHFDVEKWRKSHSVEMPLVHYLFIFK